MSRRQIQTHGSALMARFSDGVRGLRDTLVTGAREVPLVRDVTPRGPIVGSIANKIVEVKNVLVQSERVLRYGTDIVMAVGDDSSNRLVTLTSSGQVESHASARLANIFRCTNGEIQFPPPASLINMVLSDDSIVAALPRIKIYSHTPVFDQDFNLRGPGFHAGSGILVHGPDIEPVALRHNETNNDRGSDLPPHLSSLLGDFAFSGAADRANAVGALLTGVLRSHFVDHGKPVLLVDGNQPYIGKTMLVNAIGVVIDGVTPTPTAFTTNDDELQKRLCASLRDLDSRIILLDNAKTSEGSEINSPTLEANSLAPVISLRILGKSENFRRPNDVIWALTMNQTRASRDLITRSLPIQLRVDGDPNQRNFERRDAVDYAKRHRIEILGELYGMICAWNQVGRPDGTRYHRCRRWAAVTGGILEANGIPSFLANTEEVEREFDSRTQVIVGLIEHIARNATQIVYDPSRMGGSPPPGVLARDLVSIFNSAGAIRERLHNAAPTQGSMIVGNFLTAYINRTVTVEINGTNASAIWRRINSRANQNRYYVELAFTVDGSDTPTATPATDCAAGHITQPPLVGTGPGNTEEW